MSVEWIVIRGSGVVAFSMLAASTIWGLLLTTKVLGPWTRAKPLTWFHEALAVAAVLATVVHMVALSMHDYISFDWADILIPGRSGWRPVAVAFGVVSFYGAALLSVSFYFKRFIGQRAWRVVHFASFGVFVAAASHGIMAGTDTAEPWMVGLYVASATCVTLLLAIRLAQQYASTNALRPGAQARTKKARSSGDHPREPYGDQSPTEVPARPNPQVTSGRVS